MKNMAIDSTKEILNADQMSTCRSCRRARRGPRPPTLPPRPRRRAPFPSPGAPGADGPPAPDARGPEPVVVGMGGTAAFGDAGCEPVTGLPEPWLRGVLAPGMDCVDVTGGATAGVLSPVSSPSPWASVR